MKTLDQLDTAIAQTNAKVDQSNAKIDDANTRLGALAAQGIVEQFTAAVRIIAREGENVCERVVIPEGKFVKLESIIVETQGSATSAYFVLNTRVSTSLGVPVQQRIPLTSLSSENDSRSGSVQTSLWVRDVPSTIVPVGEPYGLLVCVNPADAETVTAEFYVSGVYK